MSIVLITGGSHVPHEGTFSEIFREFNKLAANKNYLRVLGALLVRNAFCLDHVEVEPGKYRYSPPPDVVAWLRKYHTKDMLCNVELFLHYIEAIAWNEDVKYTTLGYKISSGYGRRNNLMTYAHIIAVIIGEVDFMDFAGGLMRPPVGVNPLSLKKAVEIFDLLWSTKKHLPSAP